MVYSPKSHNIDQQYLSVVSHFAIDMLGMTSESEVAWYLAKDVISRLGFVDAVVYLYSEERRVLYQAAAHGNKNPNKEEILSPIEIPLGQGVVGTAAARRTPLRIGDCRSFPGYIVDDEARLSELAVPITVGQQLVGVIDSEHPEQNYFTEKHEEVLTAIASIAATKLLKTRTMDKLRSTVEQLEYNVKIQDTLFEIAELVYNTESLKEFYGALHQCISRITYARNFVIALEDRASGVIRFPYHVDEKDHFEEDTLPIDCELPNVTGYILQTQRALLADRAKLQELLDDNAFCLEGSIPEILLGVPFGDENLRGVVIVQSYTSTDVYRKKDKQLLGFVAKHIHIALKRIQAKSELEFLALHDPLTRLPNRLLFADRVEHAIQSYERHQQGIVAVMFLDLDKFKYINDTFGHHIGDKLLVAVSTSIEGVMRKSDTFARLGGDEFAVLLESVHSSKEVRAIAQKILTAVHRTVEVEGKELKVSTSIGVTLYQGDESRAEQLLIEADEAMYLAKLQGRNRVFFYDEKHSERNVHSHKFETEFNAAIVNEDLFMEFQPIVDMKSGNIVAAECLVRWDHPNLGHMFPDSFITELQKTGKMIELDIYVLRLALNHLQRFQVDGFDGFPLSVNVSGIGFASGAFVKALDSIHKQCPDLMKSVIFEITEQSLIENLDEAMSSMNHYRDFGIRIALDDFGTGYSSLSYLHRFKFDFLKIDRSFILSKDASVSSGIIFESIVNLARSLEIQTTAEGIEDQHQYRWMRELGCDYGQGYYMARPMSAEDLEALLRTRPNYD